MPRLVLINGAPGSGKSTLARSLTTHLPDAVLVDVDSIVRSLPEWSTDRPQATRVAREQAVDQIREHLATDHDVIVAHYIGRTPYIEELESDAGDLGAEFRELVLLLPTETLAQRLIELRAGVRPGESPQHPDPGEAQRLAATIHDLLIARPRAERINATGTPDETFARVLSDLDSSDWE